MKLFDIVVSVKNLLELIYYQCVGNKKDFYARIHVVILWVLHITIIGKGKKCYIYDCCHLKTKTYSCLFKKKKYITKDCVDNSNTTIL